MKQIVMLVLVFILIGLGYMSWKEMSNTKLDTVSSDVVILDAPDVPSTLLGQAMLLPEWWNNIDAPLFKTVYDINKEWQGRKRCCVSKSKLTQNNRIFYKACYNYINSSGATDEGIVKCLWLMGGSSSEGEELRRISRQLLYDNYSDYKGRIDNCANCAPADTVIRATANLAYIYSKTDVNKSAQLLETILDKRKDISPWVELETIEKLARYYKQIGLNEERAERLQTALDKFTTVRDTDDAVWNRFTSFKKAIDNALQGYTVED